MADRQRDTAVGFALAAACCFTVVGRLAVGDDHESIGECRFALDAPAKIETIDVRQSTSEQQQCRWRSQECSPGCRPIARRACRITCPLQRAAGVFAECRVVVGDENARCRGRHHQRPPRDGAGKALANVPAGLRRALRWPLASRSALMFAPLRRRRGAPER
jgi:hypothetical protein